MEGSSDADVRTFWCKKHRIFRNIWCVQVTISLLVCYSIQLITIYHFHLFFF